jgi:hypothetical protein
MPINACSADATASFDPSLSDPAGEPLCRPIPAEPVASTATEPFVRLRHELTSRPATAEVQAHAALLSGHDPETGLDLEVLSVAAQGGPGAASIEGIVERFGFSSADAKKEIHADIFSVCAELGTHNADGSDGVSLGASASAVGVEFTVGGDSDNSLTVGVGVGVGAHVSLGGRDIDNDGKPEVCAHVGVAVFTLGGCVESPF